MEYEWAVLLICGLAAIFLFWRSSAKKRRPKRSTADSSGIPEGRQQEYLCGISPCDHDKPVMYTLHTCRHCVRLKDFLLKRGIEITEVFVDDFEDPARKDIMKKLSAFNPRTSFPTLVLKDGRCVVGYREEIVKSLFGLEK